MNKLFTALSLLLLSCSASAFNFSSQMSGNYEGSGYFFRFISQLGNTYPVVNHPTVEIYGYTPLNQAFDTVITQGNYCVTGGGYFPLNVVGVPPNSVWMTMDGVNYAGSISIRIGTLQQIAPPVFGGTTVVLNLVSSIVPARPVIGCYNAVSIPISGKPRG